jgi:chemotaxis protein CheD
MQQTDHIVEVFLKPGEIYFGDWNTRIRTVLGSCVAITMWHPDKLLGGMCHYLLPSRNTSGPHVLDGKYADEALALMLNEICKMGANVGEYQIKLFGGGSMFPDVNHQDGSNVGGKNVEIAHQLLKSLGLRIHSEHISGIGHRNVIFNIWSGDVWMKHQTSDHYASGNCEGPRLCLQK